MYIVCFLNSDIFNYKIYLNILLSKYMLVPISKNNTLLNISQNNKK